MIPTRPLQRSFPWYLKPLTCVRLHEWGLGSCTLEFKSLEDARKKAQDFGWAALPTKSLFRIEPRSVGPTFKLEVDDGELAYVAQIYPQEQKVAFLTTPDAAAVFGLKDVKKERYDLILDLDFATKKPVRMESFDTMSWLAGWQRAINQDAETFLNLKVYPVHAITRKSLGDMTRKLSVTESHRFAQLRGTVSRRKPSVASANWVHVA